MICKSCTGTFMLVDMVGEGELWAMEWGRHARIREGMIMAGVGWVWSVRERRAFHAGVGRRWILAGSLISNAAELCG